MPEEDYEDEDYVGEEPRRSGLAGFFARLFRRREEADYAEDYTEGYDEDYTEGYDEDYAEGYDEDYAEGEAGDYADFDDGSAADTELRSDASEDNAY